MNKRDKLKGELVRNAADQLAREQQHGLYDPVARFHQCSNCLTCWHPHELDPLQAENLADEAEKAFATGQCKACGAPCFKSRETEIESALLHLPGFQRGQLAAFIAYGLADYFDTPEGKRFTADQFQGKVRELIDTFIQQTERKRNT